MVAVNSNGDGEASDPIELIPAALPSADETITVAYNDDGSLTLDWTVPLDTGGGDQVLIDPATLYYSFEVNEGFYADPDAAASFDPLTSKEGEDPYFLTQFTHSDLIVGHVYTYRVMAANLMGWGLHSAEFQFVPRRVPLAPSRAPWDVTSQKTRSIIYIQFDAVLDNEGDEISAYTVYIDDGLDQDAFAPYVSDTSLTWNSDTSP